MNAWLVLPELGALPPGAVFAAGATVVTLVQCAIIAWARWQARRRAERTYEFPPREPRELWADLKQLRADCETSTAQLEMSVAKLKEKAMGQATEFGSRADRVRYLQRALAQKTAVIDELEARKADLELLKERHLLQLHRKEQELCARADALATAEQTIALLRGMLDLPDRASAPMPRRATAQSISR